MTVFYFQLKSQLKKKRKQLNCQSNRKSQKKNRKQPVANRLGHEQPIQSESIKARKRNTKSKALKSSNWTA